MDFETFKCKYRTSPFLSFIIAITIISLIMSILKIETDMPVLSIYFVIHLSILFLVDKKECELKQMQRLLSNSKNLIN